VKAVVGLTVLRKVVHILLVPIRDFPFAFAKRRQPLTTTTNTQAAEANLDTLLSKNWIHFSLRSRMNETKHERL
jgi:hypothetical protein